MGGSDSRRLLWGQIEEAYGKVLYTYQTQQEAATLKYELSNCLSIIQIVLTAVSACGLIGVFSGYAAVGAIVASCLSAVSLGLNIYIRSARLPENAEAHARCADRLWALLQDYVALLVDFDDLDVGVIRARRDQLKDKAVEIYSKAPRTSDRAYGRALKRLKGGHQSFEPGECDKLLPLELRGKY